MLLKCCIQCASKFGNSAVTTELEKASFHSNPKKGKAKQCSICRTVEVISYVSKVMLKILQARLQQDVNQELPDVQAWFRKGRGTRGQIANIHWITEKVMEFQKNIYFCFTDYNKLLTVWITIIYTLPEKVVCYTCLLRNLYTDQEAIVRTRHGTKDWFKIGKGVRQGCILSPAYLIYMQSTSSKILGWVKHKLESRLHDKGPYSQSYGFSIGHVWR